jgi:periplasmic protein TonB
VALPRRRGADRRIFGIGLAVSVAAHLVALLFVALPVTPHQPSATRAPLQAVEAPLLTAVPLPEPRRRLSPPPEEAPPVNAIPVLAPQVVEAPRAAPPVVALLEAPPAPTPPEREVRPAPRALAGSVVHGQYEQEIARWVERQRDYPLAARRRGLQGTAIVRLRLGADGSLIQAQIVRDTGHSILDRAALAMVERAAPYPEVPAALGGPSVDVLVPIQFSLGG